MNKDPDYSAAYLILETDNPDLSGHSLVFTIGRGNDLQCQAVAELANEVIGESVEGLVNRIGDIGRALVRDSQIRWLGPEKGIPHMAAGGVINALWDLVCKLEGKPLWKVLSDLSPEQLVGLIDFRHITDALTPAPTPPLRVGWDTPTRLWCAWPTKPSPMASDSSNSKWAAPSNTTATG